MKRLALLLIGALALNSCLAPFRGSRSLSSPAWPT
jgi:hypothetical protein